MSVAAKMPRENLPSGRCVAFCGFSVVDNLYPRVASVAWTLRPHYSKVTDRSAVSQKVRPAQKARARVRPARDPGAARRGGRPVRTILPCRSLRRHRPGRTRGRPRDAAANAADMADLTRDKRNRTGGQGDRLPRGPRRLGRTRPGLRARALPGPRRRPRTGRAPAVRRLASGRAAPGVALLGRTGGPSPGRLRRRPPRAAGVARDRRRRGRQPGADRHAARGGSRDPRGPRRGRGLRVGRSPPTGHTHGGGGHARRLDWCTIRLRSHDEDADVLGSPDLVPELVQALRATFL